MTKIIIRKSKDNTVISPQLHGQFIEFLGTCKWQVKIHKKWQINFHNSMVNVIIPWG